MGLKLGRFLKKVGKGIGKVAKVGFKVAEFGAGLATAGVSDRVLSVAKTIGRATGVIRNPLTSASPAVQAQIAKFGNVTPRLSRTEVQLDLTQPTGERYKRAAIAKRNDSSWLRSLEGAITKKPSARSLLADVGTVRGMIGGGSRRRSTGGGKRPCKYGPRGADGYCPKKPRPTEGAGYSSSSSGRSPTSGSLGDRFKDYLAKEGARRVSRYSRRRRSSGRSQRSGPPSQTAERLGKAAASAKRVLTTPLSALPAGGVIGAALAVGLASYGATTYILKSIADKRERLAQQKFLISQAYRKARQKAAADLGRPLTAEELASMSEEFKRQIAEVE